MKTSTVIFTIFVHQNHGAGCESSLKKKKAGSESALKPMRVRNIGLQYGTGTGTYGSGESLVYIRNASGYY
jgi:hypothetical protein